MLSVSKSPDGAQLILRGLGDESVRDVLRHHAQTLQVRRQAGEHVIDVESAGGLLESGIDLEWDSDALRAATQRHRIRTNAPEVLADMRRLRDGAASEARLAIADSQMEGILDDHQAKNVAVMTLADGWGACVFDEQGTGKTVTLISAFDLLTERNLADVLLVVSPKSMVAEWAVEFDRFTSGLYKVAVADGDRRSKLGVFRQGADVVVVSYETIVSLTDEVIRLARRCRLVLAVDESFNAKNERALRTEALMAVREYCERAFALCGTPAPNAGADLVSQFNLVDLGLTFGRLELPKGREAANEVVRERLEASGFYLRSLKDRVLDLPSREFITIEVDLTGGQQRAYDAACRDLILDLREATEETYRANIANFLARRSMLLRICSDPTPVVPGYAEVPAKMLALDGLLDNLIRRGDKVVVWSFYRTTLDLLCDRYAHHGLVRVDGSVPSSDRRAAVSAFQEDPAVKIFVGNPAAAGAGLTLTAGRVAVYESMSNQAAHYMQSLDRIHRRGQAQDVEYYFLVGSGTLEVAEKERLLGKAQSQSNLLGDNLTPAMSRTTMLADLIGDGHGRPQ